MRIAWASGVPYRKVCDKVVIAERTLDASIRSARFASACSRLGRIFRSAADFSSSPTMRLRQFSNAMPVWSIGHC
jgi:hypothetical protein